MFVETKAGERDLGGGGRGWRGNDSRTDKAEHAERPVAVHVGRVASGVCPSVLEVARCESGDLSHYDQMAIRAHASRCRRCESSLMEIHQARLEILGSTAHATSTQSQQAAERIQALLRLALH